MYAFAALFFFVLGGIEALLIRLQLFGPNLELMHPETFNQLFTMHGTTMLFLAAMPLTAAFMNYLLPLQIGARDVAFPRLNSFSFWVLVRLRRYFDQSKLVPRRRSSRGLDGVCRADDDFSTAPA